MPLLEEIGVIGEALIGVAKVVEGVVNVLKGLPMQNAPLLNDAQQLAINLLNAVGKSTTDPLHLAAINTHIGIIQTDASKVDDIIKSLGLLLSNFKSVTDNINIEKGFNEIVTNVKADLVNVPTEQESTASVTHAVLYTGGDN